MPTYDYACKECGHRFEAFQSMTEPAMTTCPNCGQESLQRLIGAGAGLVFKGSGYYQTDYKKSSVPPSSPSSDTATSSADNGSGAAANSADNSGSPASSGTNGTAASAKTADKSKG